MKNRLSALMLSLLLVLGTLLSLPVLAVNAEDGESEEIVLDYFRVIDNAELLDEDDEVALEAKLYEISARQRLDVTVATTDTLGALSISEYADRLYDSNYFGYGDSRDGLLLLISLEEGNNQWYISTSGYGITAFTDAGIDYIGEQIKGELSDGNYYSALSHFAKLSDSFITQARTDKPYDSGNLPKEKLSAIWIPISIVIGFVIAKLTVSGMRSKLKTVRAQRSANSYIKDGSLNITNSRDLFLYRTVTRRAKSTDSSSSGSSTHKSSCGTVHGGGGGSF